MIFHFGINDYRDVRHCTTLYAICLPIVSRKCTLSGKPWRTWSPGTFHFGINDYRDVRHLSTDCHQKVYTSWKTMAYMIVRHCMPLYDIVCYLSTDSFQKVYTFWKTMAYMIVRHCMPLYATVCHCTPFVYRLFPESVHFLENHNSQSEKMIVQLLLMPRSVLVKLDIQMHP